MSTETEPKDGKVRPIPNDGKGRPPGIPNKATSKTREAIALVAEGMADQFKEWLYKTAEGLPVLDDAGLPTGKWINAPDPKGAADTYLKAIEYHIPKLARTEVDHSGSVTVNHEQWIDGLK